jgi:hypothetical protein
MYEFSFTQKVKASAAAAPKRKPRLSSRGSS